MKKPFFLFICTLVILCQLITTAEVLAYVDNAQEIIGTGGNKQLPDISYNPYLQKYLVVWEEYHSSYKWDIHGQIFDKDGNKIGNQFPIGQTFTERPIGSDDYHSDQNAKVACVNSDNWVVIWVSDGPANIIQTIVSSSGFVYGAKALSGKNINASNPDIGGSITNDTYLIVWEENNEIKGKRYSVDGVQTNGYLTIGDSGTFKKPSVNQRGQDFFVAWEKHVNDSRVDIEGRLVPYDVYENSDLNNLDVIPLAEDSGINGDPSVAQGEYNNDYLVVWHHEYTTNNYNIEYAFTSRTSKRLNGIVANSTDIEYRPAAVFSGHSSLDYVVLYAKTDAWGNEWDIYSRKISDNGILGNEETIIATSTSEGSPEGTLVGGANGKVIVTWDRGDEHLYSADWYVSKTYTISYNANNATNGNPPDSQTKPHDENLTLSYNTGNLARTGYTFAGWNTNSIGTGTSYAEGGTYTTNASDILYAEWTPVVLPGVMLLLLDDQKPLPPTATSATSVTTSGFQANWNSVSGATGYRLDVSTDSGFGIATCIAGYDDKDVGNVTNHSLSGLNPSTPYHYRVRAYNAGGTSADSNVKSVTTSAVTPVEPSAPLATSATNITTTSFQANWNSVSGATGYRLDVSTDIGFGTFVTGYNDKDLGNVTNHSLIGLNPSTPYHYQVRAYNAVGASIDSNRISVTTASDSGADPDFKNSLGMDFVYIQPDTFMMGSPTDEPGRSSDETQHEVTLTQGFYMQTTEVTQGQWDEVMGSNPSYFSSCGADCPVEQVSWNDVQAFIIALNVMGEGTYRLPTEAEWEYACRAGTTTPFAFGDCLYTSQANYDGFWPLADCISGEYRETTVAVASLAPNAWGLYDMHGNVYEWCQDLYGSYPSSSSSGDSRVIRGGCWDAASQDCRSASRSEYVPADAQACLGFRLVHFQVTAPSAPTATSATNVTTNSFQANWNSVSGATGYYLDVSTSSGFSSFVPGYDDKNVGNVTSYTVSGLNPSTPYHYRVRAYNDGGTSGNSDTISVTTGISAPPSPTATSATNVTTNSFQANWNSVSGATGYYLDVSTSSGFSSFVPGYDDKNVGNVTSYTVSGLNPSTPYHYRVRAYNDGGTSGNSDTISVTTGISAPPSPTATSATNVTTNSFQANWNSVSGAEGYRLDVSTESGFGTFVTGYDDKNVGNVTSYTVSGLNSSTPYHYRVRAYNDGGTSGDSDVISVITAGENPGTFTNSLGMTFVSIQPETFMMGSPTDEPGRSSDETQHQVTLTQEFYMQTTEVTQGQWAAVMGSNPSYFSNCGDDCPVETVSWNDVQDFITSLNAMGEGTYRLPTEAEWEYAARAGTAAPFGFGDCLLTSQSNYYGYYPLSGCPAGEYRETTVPVASLASNAWGLYDMHGNVGEWCQDWYGSYPSEAVTDPEGPSSGGERVERVIRGGTWGSYASKCRSAYRVSNDPGLTLDGLGFRLVLSPGH